MPMHIAVTIDTEEDNWGDYSREAYGVDNIKKIPVLQKLFDEYCIKPTYLVTYPVATNQDSVCVLKKVLDGGNCEIGMHCHPWSTPPFEEERNAYNSMLCNLSYDLQQKKLGALHAAIEGNLGVRATSFRAGRWGYSGAVSTAIKNLGYRMDTSITPLTDWSEYHGPDFSRQMPKAYRFNAPEIYRRVDGGELLEIPATIGYLQGNFARCAAVERALDTKLGRTLRLRGILNRVGLLNKVWLSPEASDARQMIELTKVMIAANCDIINMFLHSTSLQAGLSFIVRTNEDETRFADRMKEYFAFVNEAGLEPITLFEAEDIVQRSGKHDS